MQDQVIVLAKYLGDNLFNFKGKVSGRLVSSIKVNLASDLELNCHYLIKGISNGIKNGRLSLTIERIKQVGEVG